MTPPIVPPRKQRSLLSPSTQIKSPSGPIINVCRWEGTILDRISTPFGYFFSYFKKYLKSSSYPANSPPDCSPSTQKKTLAGLFYSVSMGGYDPPTLAL